jgi:hypothetical protein
MIKFSKHACELLKKAIKEVFGGDLMAEELAIGVNITYQDFLVEIKNETARSLSFYEKSYLSEESHCIHKGEESTGKTLTHDFQIIIFLIWKMSVQIEKINKKDLKILTDISMLNEYFGDVQKIELKQKDYLASLQKIRVLEYKSFILKYFFNILFHHEFPVLVEKIIREDYHFNISKGWKIMIKKKRL